MRLMSVFGSFAQVLLVHLLLLLPLRPTPPPSLHHRLRPPPRNRHLLPPTESPVPRTGLRSVAGVAYLLQYVGDLSVWDEGEDGEDVEEGDGGEVRFFPRRSSFLTVDADVPSALLPFSDGQRGLRAALASLCRTSSLLLQLSLRVPFLSFSSTQDGERRSISTAYAFECLLAVSFWRCASSGTNFRCKRSSQHSTARQADKDFGRERKRGKAGVEVLCKSKRSGRSSTL